MYLLEYERDDRRVETGSMNMEPISQQDSVEGRNFLTKERKLSARTKVVLFTSVVGVMLVGCLYSSTIALVDWGEHRQSIYQGHTVHLPIFWTEDTEARDMSWERPPLLPFTGFGDFLNTLPAPRLDTDARNVELWHRFFGFAGSNDLTLYPDLKTLAGLGMICGSIKHGQLEGKSDGQMAFGCLTKDHRTSFEYSGSASDLHQAISIIRQAQ
jgi:hypothetical protein